MTVELTKMDMIALRFFHERFFNDYMLTRVDEGFVLYHSEYATFFLTKEEDGWHFTMEDDPQFSVKTTKLSERVAEHVKIRANAHQWDVDNQACIDLINQTPYWAFVRWISDSELENYFTSVTAIQAQPLQGCEIRPLDEADGVYYLFFFSSGRPLIVRLRGDETQIDDISDHSKMWQEVLTTLDVDSRASS